MKLEKIQSAIGGLIIWLLTLALCAFITGVFVMLFWNWVMPMLFGLPTIGYMEGWAISVLSGMLFRPAVSSKDKDKDKEKKEEAEKERARVGGRYA